jgi:hypothetical protein
MLASGVFAVVEAEGYWLQKFIEMPLHLPFRDGTDVETLYPDDDEHMSFTFHWPRFSDQFHYDAIEMLNTALNKGNKPPIIADKIEVVELEMGTQVCKLA